MLSAIPSQANKMSKQEYLMYRAIQKMLHFKLACAYDKWRSDYLEMKNMMKIFKNAAKRWRQQKLSKAWNQWRFVAAKMLAFLEGMSKEEMLEKLEAAYAKIAEQEAEIRSLRQRLAKYEHYTALGAINRMMKLGLSKGWEKWQYEYAEQVRLARLMKGTVRRMQNRLLSKAFEKWQFEVCVTVALASCSRGLLHAAPMNQSCSPVVPSVWAFDRIVPFITSIYTAKMPL